jgi:hypothetical protein
MMAHLVPVCHANSIPIGGSSKLRPRTTLIHAHSTTPEIVAPSLCSETQPEGRIGYRECTRGNGRLGAIDSIDDRYVHDVDDAYGIAPHLPDRTNVAEDVLAASFTLAGTRRGKFSNGGGVGRRHER